MERRDGDIQREREMERERWRERLPIKKKNEFKAQLADPAG